MTSSLPDSCRFTKKLSREAVRGLLNDYARGVPVSILCETRKITKNAVKRWLRLSGIPRRANGGQRLVPSNEGAFDTVTEESAYWAGFLMADGCVSITKGRTPHIVLALALRDAEHIHKFRAFVGATGKVTVHPPGSRGGSTMSTSICSNRLADSLARFGVVPRKTGHERVLDLESNRDFWRGVIDGDGTVCYVRCTQRRNGRVYRYRYPVVRLCTGPVLAGQFNAYCKTILPKSRARVYLRDRVGYCHYSTRQARTIVDRLYTGAGVYLERKMALARQMLGVHP